MASAGPRQKPAFAEPVNDNGRGIAIPEECEISQNSQIAPTQIALRPRARWWCPRQVRPPVN